MSSDRADYLREYNRENRDKKRARDRKSWNSPTRKISRLRYTSSFIYRLREWKRKARNRGIGWTVSDEYLNSRPLICYYTGMELTLTPNKFNTVSLDRIDSKKGYSQDNVVFCSADINRMKNKHQLEYFIDLCRKVAEKFRI